MFTNFAWAVLIKSCNMKFVWVAVLVAGCTSPNPLFCEVDEDCENGTICDPGSLSCVSAPGPECTANAECIDPLHPICGPAQTCLVCTADTDCESGVCEVEGSCLSESAILYASATGVETGSCEARSPCELFYARSLIDESRFTILLAEGNYSLPVPFDIDATRPRVRIVGGGNVVANGSFGGPAFRVTAGGSLVARDVTSNAMVCVGGRIALSRVQLDGLTTRPRIELQSCDAEIVGSSLESSPQPGVLARNSDTRLVDTRIEGSTGNNVTATDGGKLEIVRCTMLGATEIGIDVAGATLFLHRSRVLKNRLGGVRSLGGLFDVTNNFVFGNGDSGGAGGRATFGGMRLETSLPGARIEHNTIVRNDSDISVPSFAGGLYCVGAATAPNNLIDDNFAGNATQPQSQYAGTCDVTDSLISDGSVDMRYVALGSRGFSSSSETDDYHLETTDSPAVDTGLVGTIVEDFDGEQRADTTPDIGADELVR